MQYSFSDILGSDLYSNSRVLFILGKNDFFNNMVSDELKKLCTKNVINIEDNPDFAGLSDEFADLGAEPVRSDEQGQTDISGNSVNFNTFMDIIGVASINGKWFCKVELSGLNKRQTDMLEKYIKEPSDNGILVITSHEWKDYGKYLRNKTLLRSKKSNIIQLNYPHRETLKKLIQSMFRQRGISATLDATNIFLQKMSSAYNEYESVINSIADEHIQVKLQQSEFEIMQEKEDEDGGAERRSKKKNKDSTYQLIEREMNEYLKERGIENYVIEDFIEELTKPMRSDKANRKKVLKIMVTLQDEYGAKNLVYRLLTIVNECIDFRILINSGYIPIGINYFFNDIIKEIDDDKYKNMNEWVFRRKANLASLTSLRDWEYMSIILRKSIGLINNETDEFSTMDEDVKASIGLYELCTRSVLTESRLNNILGIDNVFNTDLNFIDSIKPSIV